MPRRDAGRRPRQTEERRARPDPARGRDGPAAVPLARSRGGGGPENGGEADGSEPKDGAGGARLDAGGVERGADARGDAAAQEARHVERRRRVDLGEGDVGDHDVLAAAVDRTVLGVGMVNWIGGHLDREPEARAPHEMVERLSLAVSIPAENLVNACALYASKIPISICCLSKSNLVVLSGIRPSP